MKFTRTRFARKHVQNRPVHVALAIVGAEVVLAASFAVAGMIGLSGHAQAQPNEDEPGWSCVDTATRICGPLSDDYGHAPGCYNDARQWVTPWPCHVVVNPVTGDGDIWEGLK